MRNAGHVGEVVERLPRHCRRPQRYSGLWNDRRNCASSQRLKRSLKRHRYNHFNEKNTANNDHSDEDKLEGCQTNGSRSGSLMICPARIDFSATPTVRESYYPVRRQPRDGPSRGRVVSKLRAGSGVPPRPHRLMASQFGRKSFRVKVRTSWGGLKGLRCGRRTDANLRTH